MYKSITAFAVAAAFPLVGDNLILALRRRAQQREVVRQHCRGLLIFGSENGSQYRSCLRQAASYANQICSSINWCRRFVGRESGQCLELIGNPAGQPEDHRSTLIMEVLFNNTSISDTMTVSGVPRISLYETLYDIN
jgi:hypothetical protein